MPEAVEGNSGPTVWDLAVNVWTWANNKETLAAAFLVLLSVVITLSVNAWIPRRQRAKEQQNKRNALRAGLVEEMKFTFETTAVNLLSLKNASAPKDGRPNFNVPVDIIDDFYKANLAHLGILPPNEIRAVMNAYLRLEAKQASIGLVGRQLESGSYTVVSGEDIQHLIGWHTNILYSFENAISELGGDVEPGTTQLRAAESDGEQKTS